MSAMSDPAIPFSILAQFHREAVAPDIERIAARLEALEVESAAIEAGLRRVEGRLDSLVGHRELAAEVRSLDGRLSGVEKRLDELVVSQQRDAFLAELQKLRARVSVVETQMATLQKPPP